MNLGWLMETPISRASSEENRPRHADRAGVCAPNEEEEEEEQSSRVGSSLPQPRGCEHVDCERTSATDKRRPRARPRCAPARVDTGAA